jgi:hypothetical protein
MSGKQSQEVWNKFVKLLEHDITGPQIMGFKIYKQLHLEEKDRLKIHTIKKDWQKYYEKLK